MLPKIFLFFKEGMEQRNFTRLNSEDIMTFMSLWLMAGTKVAKLNHLICIVVLLQENKFNLNRSELRQREVGMYIYIYIYIYMHSCDVCVGTLNAVMKCTYQA